jgi:hypothetical protein
MASVLGGNPRARASDARPAAVHTIVRCQPAHDPGGWRPGGGRYSGYVLTGLALFADDHVPTFGTASNTQVIVCRPDNILQLEGPPIPYCYPPSVAENLEAILGLRAYVATVKRFAEGVVTVTGVAYKASTFT